MKLLHIITGLSTGGAERALYNLLNGGLSSEFETHVISLSDEGTIGPQIKALGVPVITLGMKAGRPSLVGLLKLRTAIKTLKPDLIQGWMYHGNLAASLARFFASNKPALVWNIRHSLYHIEKEKCLTRQVIKFNCFLSHSVDTVLYNSQLSRQQHEAFGFSGSKGLVIPNGINCEQFGFSVKARKTVREVLVIPESAIVVGHVARFHPMKDHANFLKAAVQVLDNFPETHFLLIGRGVDNKNPDINKLIPDSFRQQFHLLGERTDIAELMNAMDVFCMSSAWGEAFPNVLGEAMAVGVPCVATDVGDSRLIVGDCGKIVPANDSGVLTRGIEALIQLELKERHTLGKLASQRIKENFMLEVITQRYVDLYRELK